MQRKGKQKEKYSNCTGVEQMRAKYTRRYKTIEEDSVKRVHLICEQLRYHGEDFVVEDLVVEDKMTDGRGKGEVDDRKCNYLDKMQQRKLLLHVSIL
ncbi:hypothetical protein EVAR_66432_1 [Eumeta japonica]|uniref:Uncharacterized protein n=1 Tax=Eumeta variegata TaxID=151549 RepID=A0A4C1ZH23_EUMVA|nr:hypothetical protein EVAR_66432_1 [Eumeta japonica]